MNQLCVEFDCATIDRYSEHYFRMYPRRKKAPIPHPWHPSINEWMIMKRPAMNALKQRWKEFITWVAEDQGYANLRIDKCDIAIDTYYQSNRPHDVDNSVPKFILDGLVAAGMLIDDNDRHVLSLLLRCHTDAKHPRTVITLNIKE